MIAIAWVTKTSIGGQKCGQNIKKSLSFIVKNGQCNPPQNRGGFCCVLCFFFLDFFVFFSFFLLVSLGRTPKGAYSTRGRSRHLLETPFSEPLLRTLLRTPFYCKTHRRPPSQNPSENPFPRTLPRTFSEPFSERCVAVRPLRRASYSCCFMTSWNPKTAHQMRLQAEFCTPPMPPSDGPIRANGFADSRESPKVGGFQRGVFVRVRDSEMTIKINFRFLRGGGALGAERKIVQNAVFFSWETPRQ